jgi:hypothetical protein
MQRPLFALSLISLTLALTACGGGEGTVGTPGVAIVAAVAPTGGTTGGTTTGGTTGTTTGGTTGTTTGGTTGTGGSTGTPPAPITQSLTISSAALSQPMTLTMAAATDLQAQTQTLADGTSMYLVAVPDAGDAPSVTLTVVFAASNPSVYFLSLGSYLGGDPLKCVSGGWTAAQLQEQLGVVEGQTLATCDGTVTINPTAYTVVATNVTLAETYQADVTASNATSAVTSFSVQLPKP